MHFFQVTFSCALLVLQCVAQLPLADLDADSLSPDGLQTLQPLDQPPISLQTLYEELRNQSTITTEWVEFQLERMITAAVDGDEFYHLEVDLSDHNRRTAQVSIKMLLQFSTLGETQAALQKAIVYTIEQVMSNSSHLRHPLEVLYDRLDELLRQDSNVSATYGRLTANFHDSVSPSNRKRYFNRVINFLGDYFPLEPNFVSIPGNLKLLLQTGFRHKLQRQSRLQRQSNEYVLANAIYNLGRNERYAEKVEQIRENVTSEVLSLMLEFKQTMVPFFFDHRPFVGELLHRLEQSINEQPDLRDEFLKEKRTIERKTKTEDLVGNSLK